MKTIITRRTASAKVKPAAKASTTLSAGDHLRARLLALCLRHSRVPCARFIPSGSWMSFGSTWGSQRPSRRWTSRISRMASLIRSISESVSSSVCWPITLRIVVWQVADRHPGFQWRSVNVSSTAR